MILTIEGAHLTATHQEPVLLLLEEGNRKVNLTIPQHEEQILILADKQIQIAPETTTTHLQDQAALLLVAEDLQAEEEAPEVEEEDKFILKDQIEKT